MNEGLLVQHKQANKPNNDVHNPGRNYTRYSMYFLRTRKISLFLGRTGENHAMDTGFYFN